MNGRPSDAAVGRRLARVLGEEAEVRAPDRLVEAVFARTQATRQARRWPWERSLPEQAYERRARPVVAVLVMVALAVAVGLPLLGREARGPGSPGSPGSSAPQGVPTLTGCPGASGLAGSGTTLWLACPTGVERIDTAIGRFAAGVPRPGVGLPSVGPLGAFAASADGVVRLSDGEPRLVVAIPAVTLVATGAANIYATDAQDRLVSIDPASGRVIGSVALTARPLALLAFGGDVWVATDDGRVSRHDGRSLAVTLAVTAGSRPARLAASTSAIFALSPDDGTLTRIDLGTGVTVTGNVRDPADRTALDALLASDAGLWITRRAELYAVDPGTLVLAAGLTLPTYPSGISLDGGAAWVLGADGQIDRVPLPRGL
jgi:hypothetical protein